MKNELLISIVRYLFSGLVGVLLFVAHSLNDQCTKLSDELNKLTTRVTILESDGRLFTQRIDQNTIAVNRIRNEPEISRTTINELRDKIEILERQRK